MRVLSVTSELFPLIKTGGLADVAGALPAALAAEGVAMRTLLPGYRSVLAKLGGPTEVARFAELMGGPARLLAEGPDLLLLDAPHLYDRPGNPYLGPDGKDWPDNAQRYAALAWVARELAFDLLPDWQPDVVHGHDWQGALAMVYLALAERARPATVLTIHNIAFQGIFPASLLTELRLPAAAFTMAGLEYYGQIGFLKGGLAYADRITTVSPTYAEEIMTPEFGMGLEGVLQMRAQDLVGIINGIDPAIWNPAKDEHLTAPYDSRKLAARGQNKAALQARFDLAVAPDAPLFCVVSRLTTQKGMDLLLAALPELTAGGGQLALLGAGDAELEAGFTAAMTSYPGQVGAVIGYDEGLSHLLQGGSDAILIPSRFEPCGLTQLYGLRYGCLPVVARVGGLADTVVDANDAALADGVATGLQFAPVTLAALRAVLARAMRLYRDRPAWQQMQQRAMSRQFDWTRPAKLYAALYRDAIERRGLPASAA